MRRLTILLALAAFLFVGGPRSRLLTPIFAEQVAIVARPVALDDNDRVRKRVGELIMLGGWELTSRSPQFTGWSGLAIDGDRFSMIGDWGSVLRFRMTRFGRAVDARIDPLPAGCGSRHDKRYRDSESIVGDGVSWWIGFEWLHRICRVDREFAMATGTRDLPDTAKWLVTGGAEAMVGLSDGRFLVFAERRPEDGSLRPLLIFDGDPVAPGTRVRRTAYLPPDGYSPTDAAEFPDGRILVVHRRLTLADRFTAVLSVVDPAALASGKPVTGRIIARFVPPVLHDNFEGVTITREGDRTIVWLLSDDNSMAWQATYLLKFALDPAVKPLGRPSSSQSSASDAAPSG